jgi:hypothetical protein
MPRKSARVLVESIVISDPHTLGRPAACMSTHRPAISIATVRTLFIYYIAVGGSWIGDHQITGTWTLHVYLDGASTPSSTQTFVLVP